MMPNSESALSIPDLSDYAENLAYKAHREGHVFVEMRLLALHLRHVRLGGRVSAIACCVESCGASVCFTPELERRLRETHEWWMCPFGHRQHFVKETEQEELRRLAERARDRWRAMFENQDEAFGTCPFCGWRSRSHYDRRWLYLLRHFTKAHEDILRQRTLVWSYYKAREEGAA